MEVNDPLVGAAPEKELSVSLFQNKGSIHEDVDPWQELREFLIRANFFDCKACPAPYGLFCLFLDSFGKGGEAFDLIERIASGEGHIGHAVSLDDLHYVVNFHPFAAVHWPRLGVVAAFAVVEAAGAVDGSTESRPVCHRLLYYIENSDSVHTIIIS